MPHAWSSGTLVTGVGQTLDRSHSLYFARVSIKRHQIKEDLQALRCCMYVLMYWRPKGVVRFPAGSRASWRLRHRSITISMLHTYMACTFSDLFWGPCSSLPISSPYSFAGSPPNSLQSFFILFYQLHIMIVFRSFTYYRAHSSNINIRCREIKSKNKKETREK